MPLPLTKNTGTTTGYDYNQIQEGNNYSFCWEVSSVVSAINQDCLIRTPASKYIHFIFDFNASRNGSLYFYENVSVSAVSVATQLSINNSNRGSSNTSLLSTYIWPSISAVSTGILLTNYTMGSDSTPLGHNVVLEYARANEYVLKQNEDYLIRFNASCECRASMNGYFYETDT